MTLTNNEKLTRVLNYLDKKTNRDYSYGKLQPHDSWDREYIILTDWNNLPKHFASWIENNTDNTTTGYDDEYDYCSECAQIIQTNPDSYSWIPNYIITEYGLICRNCVTKDIDYLIEEYKNDDNRAIPSWGINLITNEGFICLDDDESSCKIFQSGFHPGQTDNPKDILEELEKEFGFPVENKYNRLWAITSTGQFDIHFSLYLREIDNE